MDGKSLGLRIPSAATLSRARGRLDVAYMLYFRQIVCNHLEEEGIRSWLLWDRSPQASRDYEMMIFSFEPVKRLVEMREAIISLDIRLLFFCCCFFTFVN